MITAIVSDIHGNEKALSAVFEDISNVGNIEGIVLLGDIVDYGPHSNEVIVLILNCKIPIICNIWGNHEDAIINEKYDKFSSDRGRASAKYTLRTLSQESLNYIRHDMDHDGVKSFKIGNKKCLAVHGSLEDIFWGSIKHSSNLEGYQEYDYVFSGHSHEPHFFEYFYKADSPQTRNRKKTIFINPGSVGQPRNINCCAQYSVLNTDNEEVIMRKVLYDVDGEMASFSGNVDAFYRDRLKIGV